MRAAGAAIWFALSAVLAPAHPQDAPAEPVAFAPVRAAYPEGPTVRGEDVYWAEMNTHRVRRWRAGQVETVFTEPGCGPTAVELAPDDGFWIICHLDDRVVRVDRDFAPEFAVDTVDDGTVLHAPNDASPDGEGGVFVSSAGLFSLNAPPTGRVIHVAAAGDATVVHGGLRYANGVVHDPGGRRMFVSEHLDRRVWRIDPPSEPGGETAATVFFDFNAAGLAHAYDQAGPDGLLLTPDGGLLIAEYGEGRLLLVDADGALQKEIAAPAPFVTNLAFAPYDPDMLVVTASHTNHKRLNEGVVAAVRWR